jgi:hypothetical protein
VHVAVKSGHLHDAVIRKAVARQAGNHIGNVGRAVDQEVGLERKLFSERAAEIGLDLDQPFGLGIDGIEERLDRRLIAHRAV